MEMSGAKSVGIVVPAYYARPYLAHALEGVVNQEGSFTVKLVVIEDGTPKGEDAESIVRQFPSASYQRLEANHGVFHARWVGAQQLPSVDYVAFLDQDDRWRPNFLARLSGVLEQDPNLAFAACNMAVHRDGHVASLYTDRVPSLALADLKVANQLISPSQVLVRGAAFRQLTLDPDLKAPGADDWLMWLALLAPGGGATYIHEVLADYRDHPGGAHRQRAVMLASERLVVDQWFPRLGFSRWDQRRFRGRLALDQLAEGIKGGQLGKVVSGLASALGDPVAFTSAMRFRQDHKMRGIL